MNFDIANIVSKWLSRIILRTSTAAIKLAFRRIENISIKIVKMEENLSFNETCIIYIYM